MTQATCSILIVEDDLVVAKDLQSSLRELGYDAFAIAASAGDAMAHATERRPDSVLVDIRIKGAHDGIHTAAMRHAVRACAAATPTASADQPAKAAVAWPEIEGIDTQGARQRWCDDLPLFRSMLKRCLDEFSDIAVPPSRCNSPELRLQAARMHKLRGGASMLGANAIGHLSAEAEAACLAGDDARAGQLAIGVAAHLEALRANAAQAFEAERTAAPGAAAMGSATPPQATPSGPIKLEPQAVADLVLQMRQGRMSALIQFKSLEPQLKRVMGAGPLDFMRAQMDNLEFTDAATVLESLVL